MDELSLFISGSLQRGEPKSQTASTRRTVPAIAPSPVPVVVRISRAHLCRRVSDQCRVSVCDPNETMGCCQCGLHDGNEMSARLAMFAMRGLDSPNSSQPRRPRSRWFDSTARHDRCCPRRSSCEAVAVTGREDYRRCRTPRRGKAATKEATHRGISDENPDYSVDEKHDAIREHAQRRGAR